MQHHGCWLGVTSRHWWDVTPPPFVRITSGLWRCVTLGLWQGTVLSHCIGMPVLFWWGVAPRFKVGNNSPFRVWLWWDVTPPPLMEHDTPAFGCTCLTLRNTSHNTDFQCVTYLWQFLSLRFYFVTLFGVWLWRDVTPPPLMEHDTAAFGCACLTLKDALRMTLIFIVDY